MKISHLSKSQIWLHLCQTTTKSDNGIILVRKYDKEDNVQECCGQFQTEVQLIKVACGHCKAGFNDVYNITTDDLAPDISILESESATMEANSNDPEETGYDDAEDRKILSCIQSTNPTY